MIICCKSPPQLRQGGLPGGGPGKHRPVKGSERYRLEAGQLQVVAGLIGAAAETDTRSQAQRALDDANTAVGRVDAHAEALPHRHARNRVQLPADIITIISHWTAAVKRGGAGHGRRPPNPRKLVARFGAAHQRAGGGVRAWRP